MQPTGVQRRKNQSQISYSYVPLNVANSHNKPPFSDSNRVAGNHWSVRHVQRNITRSTPFVRAVTYSFHFCYQLQFAEYKKDVQNITKHQPTIFTLTAHTSGVEGERTMTEEKRKAYELSYQRTAKKIEQRRKAKEKWQKIALILMLCMITIYTGS